jgi:peptidoglycan hydrolase-like protein with peptidoglycan-binding domain
MRRSKIRAALVALAMAVSSFGIVVGSSAPAEAATPCVQKLYRMGSRGDCVRYIQALQNWGPTTIAVDGIWGAKTETAIRKYQRFWGLQADGIVGPKTWKFLCSPQMGSLEYPNRYPASFPLWAAKGAGCPGADKGYQ